MNEIIALIQKHRLTIQTVESFTGGKLASHCLLFPGASTWFRQGWVLYQTQAKANWLGIPWVDMANIEVVSEAYVKLIIDKARREFPGAITLVTTGNAGPTAQGQTSVGTFYLGIADDQHQIMQRHQSTGDRLAIQDTGVKMALMLLKEFLSTYYERVNQ
jgi:PncC family amidohydrolase